MSTERGFRLPLAARIFFASGIMVAIAVALAALVTLQYGRKAGEDAVDHSLEAANNAQERFEALSFQKLDIVAKTIINDASFVRYVATATVGSSGLNELGIASAPDAPVVAATEPDESGSTEQPASLPPPEPDADSASVKDLLTQFGDSYDVSFGMVLDADGRVVARTDEREAFADDLSDDPLFGTMVKDIVGVTGYWRNGLALLQVSAQPMVLQDELVGFLVIGVPVDASVVKQVREVSGGEVAFWVMDEDKLRLIATSVDDNAASLLKESIARIEPKLVEALQAGRSLPRVRDLSLGAKTLAASLAPLFGQPGDTVGGVITMTSIDTAMAPFQSIRNAVLLGGLIALLLSLAVSWWLARRVLRPVSELIEAAEQAAGGNYHQQLTIEGNDEVARLGRAFDSLLSDLREKKDIEGYVGHLSRFLPDPGAEVQVLSAAPAPKPVTRRECALVGLELRRFLRAPPKGEEAITLTALGQLIEEAVARAQAAGGELLEQEGPRLLFGFGGESSELRALAAVSAWWEGRIGSSDNGAAAALALGEIVHGSLPARPESSATIGLPVLQVERLLAETPVGQILLSPAFGERIKRIGQTGVLRAAQGQSSGKRFLSIDRPSLGEVARLAPGLSQATVMLGVDGAATQVAGAASPMAADQSSTRLALGMRFAGRYEILAVLGAGGMGMVYKARDTDLSDVVALKMLRPGMVIDAEQLDALKVELKLARKITHPNVLRTYDFGEFQGVPYISMEYVRGLTLRYLLQQAGRLPFSAALRIARQLCMGLDAAHQMGVIHRDIKPENIIIEQSGNAKLMDFGIARSAGRSDSRHTQPGTFLGTPNYASPEQLSGSDLDQRTDIYSTGVMLCEMFCGKLPFTGSNTMELYVAHLQQQPIKPSEMWPDIPRALEEVILKCLEKRPEDRYASSADLLVALSGLRA
ncbi:MAG: protein kinase [Xanthomonadales bacterium]|nr:protein kinase [Xanthomonadales bacterium]